MKKRLLVMALAIVFCVAGCSKEEQKILQSVSVTEEALQSDDTGSSLDAYMASVKEQSDHIKEFLEHDAMTQADMNVKSQELYELWDDALNYLWDELKGSLPEEEFAVLRENQRTWIADKEKAMEEAGKEVEGGSMYALVVNMEAANLTEARVYEFYEMLKEK